MKRLLFLYLFFFSFICSVYAPIKLLWNYNDFEVTDDMIFKIYYTSDLCVPVLQWDIITVPGGFRSIVLPTEVGSRFFVMTASNYLGESDFNK